jgi:aquaporin Z
VSVPNAASARPIAPIVPAAGGLARHWPEYAIEAALLGTFMLSACLFTVLLFHPASPVAAAIAQPAVRRVLMGIAMGGTAVALNYSGWGKQSGAHYNPAVTLTFLRLGRIGPRDASAYVAAQFAGAALGVAVAALLAGPLVADSSVHYAVTVPGPLGVGVALAAELVISFILMTVVLRLSSHPRHGRFTGMAAGLLVASFIAVESPLSGMSMNPARTVGSAVWAHDWTSLWIYFVAPLAGMLAAAELHLHAGGRLFCAKLHHQNSKRCIHCEYRAGFEGTAGGQAAL